MGSNNFANLGSGIGNNPIAFGGPGSQPVIPPNITDGSGAIPSVGRVLQLPLPEIFPIPDAKEFNPTGLLSIVGAVAGSLIPLNPPNLGTTNPVGELELPASTLGVIRGVTLYVNNLLATSNITFTLLVDGKGIPGYTAVPIFPRAAPSVAKGYDSLIRLVGPCLVTAQVTETDGGSYTVGVSLSGWFWPQSSDTRWKTQGPV